MTGAKSAKCFNGAALVQSGRQRQERDREGLASGFNGAALVQSGRPAPRTVFRPGRVASMGPLLFRAEDNAQSSQTIIQLTLQWGRSCSERKTMAVRTLNGIAATASMGPLLFRAEDPDSSGEHDTKEIASMGPLLFRAEDVCQR